MIKPRALTSLSIFLPCYNEADNLPAIIQDLHGVESYGVDYEAIIVDDGSTDGTAERVRAWAAANPHVRLVRHEKNLGYGAALRSGFETCRKDLVLLMDGDHQFRFADAEKLFSKIDSCDAVVGYRLNRQDKGYRRFNGWLWTRLVRLLFGLRVRDVDCAFKLFRRRALAGIRLSSTHLLIHAEVLARLKKKGGRIEEIGVTHYPRTAGRATATGLGRILKTFAELARLYRDIVSEGNVGHRT